MDLSTGQVTKIERVKNYKTPEDEGGFVAYLKEAEKDDKKLNPLLLRIRQVPRLDPGARKKIMEQP